MEHQTRSFASKQKPPGTKNLSHRFNSRKLYYLIYQYRIFSSTDTLPENWDEVSAQSLFLQSAYLRVLENSAPSNIRCEFIGIYQQQELIATAMLQQVDLAQLDGFGSRDNGILSSLRNLLFKQFSSKLAILGNNMLTGQHAVSFSNKADKSAVLTTLKHYLSTLNPAPHHSIFKDFEHSDRSMFDLPTFKKSLEFSSQPNMFFDLHSDWKKESDYVLALTKKYRDQYKRARKKADGIEKRQLTLEEIKQLETEINQLYRHVAENAPFNTFFLAKNHFYALKQELGDAFRFFAYFENGQLIGFNTLIHHDEILETYFLGYDEKVQREKMLYLNMLYDMVGCSIHNGFKRINFGRTALEIKSSVGAQPEQLYGWMQHENKLINRYLGFFFKLLEPEVKWIERNPFKS
ncbi:GNAT family N-acetyltransferase [Aquirufa regiilacus]|uniref:GNAT family N-acetyltransferase n=1 Tax=Aquirufa regiilacus TaxID=3024868 RepID=A0ABU3TPN8_9BACT|nr:GNAT family N-acetyltransferase [Aquirufa sp. LEOWEIH-7C]MDU0807780.1 GNAT family N-acetyltransferase [Aquirufa sp. LEOWEIH-7C]